MKCSVVLKNLVGLVFCSSPYTTIYRGKSGNKTASKTWTCPGQCGLVVWSTVLYTNRFVVRLSFRTHHWVVSLIPSWGEYRRQPMDVSLSSLLPLSLKSINIVLKKPNSNPSKESLRLELQWETTRAIKLYNYSLY